MNESIKQLITCKWCQSIVDEPVLLPCSKTVCRKHSIEISNSRCIFCDNIHVLRESQQFPANEVVQDLLKLRIKELDFGPNHKNAADRVNELNNLINDCNSMEDHPDDYISEHFRKQRNNIDLAREKLMLDINQISDRLISEMDLQEKECKANLLKFSLNTFNDNFASIKADLSKWEQDLKYLMVNESLWTSINTKCSEHVETLKQNRMGFQEKLLGKPCELKTDSHFSEIFIKQLTTNEGTLQFKITKLSSYRNINKLTNVYSKDYLFLKNFPLRILVKFEPNETRDDINCGIFVNASMIKEIYKSQDWKMELGLAAAILDNAGSKAFENSCLSGEYAISSKNDSPSLGWSNTLKLKKIIEDETLNAYNKKDDSMTVEIQVRLLDFKTF